MPWQINKVIGRVLDEITEKYPGRLAVKDNEKSYTYSEWNRWTDLLAKGLLARGVKKGMHIGIWAEDCARTLALFYALWKVGAVVVPLCTSYTKQELAQCVESVDIKILFVGKGERGIDFRQTCAELPGEVEICSIANDSDLEELCGSGCMTSERQLVLSKRAVEPADIDTIIFTSGTTGFPRPVLTTHFSRVNTMFEQAHCLEATEEDRFCSAIPMYHCFALTATVLAALCAGGCVCFPENRHGKTILETIERDRCTVFSAVPTLFRVLLRCLKEQKFDISSLRTGLIGGSTYQPAFFCQICREMDFTLLPSLGQTEATAGITAGSLRDSLEVRATTLGRFFPHIEGCIKDPCTGEKLPPEKVGEICIRGFSVMQGYYRMPKETASVIDADHWLHTGDLGKIDDAGYITYAGRIKELIIRGGENISPVEIEGILRQDPRINQVKIIGVPDQHYDEEICACIICNDLSLTKAEIQEIVRKQAADFKVPKYVLFFDCFPVTTSGKIQFNELKRLAIEKLKQDQFNSVF